MDVEQIIYGSAKRRRMKGYQVIGKSAGIDPSLAAAFCQWAPSHDSLEVTHCGSLTDAWALSYYPISKNHYAIARTVHGGPEYSGRGGLSVVTNALVMSREQLFAYQYHAIDIARTAVVLGHLLLRVEQDEKLPVVSMTRSTLSFEHPKSDFVDSSQPLLSDDAVNAIALETVGQFRNERKVIISGRCDPLPILNHVLDHLSVIERSDCSFACGLKPTSRRNFRIQITQEPISPKYRKELERSAVETIDVERFVTEKCF